jgi:hypothetical protein
MTIFNVHIYREMKLRFDGVEADTPEAAATIAHGKPTGDADDIIDCDGEDFAALVDVAGDEEFEQSRTIDFEPERQRKACPKLLDALRWITCCPMIVGPADTTAYIVSDERIAQARAAVAEAEAARIPSRPTAPNLLSALEGILDYAENEAYALEKLKDSPEAEAEAHKAWKAVEAAQAAISHAKAAGLQLEPHDIDIHALLAKRQQIAAVWSVEDVQKDRPDLSDDDAWEVLQSVADEHDCNYGITWDTLRITADHLFGPAPKTAESQGASHEPR